MRNWYLKRSSCLHETTYITRQRPMTADCMFFPICPLPPHLAEKQGVQRAGSHIELPCRWLLGDSLAFQGHGITQGDEPQGYNAGIMGLSLVTTNGAFAGHQTKHYGDQPCETSCNIHTILPLAKSWRQGSILQNHWTFPPSSFAHVFSWALSLSIQTCACLPEAITWVPNPVLASSS